MNDSCQVLDNNRLSLQEFAFHSGFTGPAERSVIGRRDFADALATVSWFQLVQQRSGNQTPYALGLKVKPESYQQEPGLRNHPNKWAKYKRGLHRPTRDLLARTDQIFPGTARQIDLPIWTLIKNPIAPRLTLEKIESRLELKVLVALAKWRPRIAASRNGSIGKFASVLERLASLDALTAMLLQLCVAKLEGNWAQAREWGRYIYRCLMIVGPVLLEQGIARPFFELLQLRFLGPLAREGWNYHFPAQRYVAAVEWMNCWREVSPQFPRRTRGPSQVLSLDQRILDGEDGWYVQSAFNPFRQRQPYDAPVSARLDSDCESERGRHEYAWSLRDVRARLLSRWDARSKGKLVDSPGPDVVG